MAGRSPGEFVWRHAFDAVVDGYEIKVLARDAAGPGAPELPAGETGVMWVKGDSVAMVV